MGRHLAHLARGIDVSAAVAQLDANPQLWNQFSLRTAFYGSPHNHISDIWVRYNAFDNFDSADPAAFNAPHESVFYPAWETLTELHRHVFDIMRFAHSTRLGGVLITRVPAGGQVDRHIDLGWHARYYDKYALQLKASPGQAFHFEDDAFVSAPGDLYTFDNSFTHWVTNDSDQERVTLIICIRRE